MTESITIDLDRFDLALIDALLVDARLSHVELADRVNLSASAVARRLKRLESAGIIRGYRADLSLRAFGLRLTVFVQVTLDRQSAAALDLFEAAVRRSPSVVACHLMSGGADYLLVLACRDMEDYERVHRDELGAIPGVMHIQSNFSLREVVGWAIPAATLSQEPRKS